MKCLSLCGIENEIEYVCSSTNDYIHFIDKSTLGDKDNLSNMYRSIEEALTGSGEVLFAAQHRTACCQHQIPNRLAYVHQSATEAEVLTA